MSVSQNRMFQTFKESRRRKLEHDLKKIETQQEEFDTLKLLSLLNNTKNHEPEDFVFNAHLIKEYKENIEKLKYQQEKVKKSYEACTGLAMASNKNKWI